jgi:hypothetical protein
MSPGVLNLFPLECFSFHLLQEQPSFISGLLGRQEKSDANPEGGRAALRGREQSQGSLTLPFTFSQLLYSLSILTICNHFFAQLIA